MKKTAVIFKSKYGSTKTYAEWVAQALDADLFDATQVVIKDLVQYQTIVFGGGLYASGIIGSDFIIKNFNRFTNKRIVVFTVGLANPQLTDYTSIIEKNFPPGIRKAMKVFHLRGAIDYKNINTIHKAMMAMLVKKVSRIDEKDRDDEMNLMLETYGQTVDFTDRSSIKDLVDYCREFTQTD